MKAVAASNRKCHERLASFATSFRTRLEWLVPFLKRRWMLMSCMVVLLGCSCFSLVGMKTTNAGGMHRTHGAGLLHGRFYYSDGNWPGTFADESSLLQATHRPIFGGGLPRLHLRAN